MHAHVWCVVRCANATEGMLHSTSVPVMCIPPLRLRWVLHDWQTVNRRGGNQSLRLWLDSKRLNVYLIRNHIWKWPEYDTKMSDSGWPVLFTLSENVLGYWLLKKHPHCLSPQFYTCLPRLEITTKDLLCSFLNSVSVVKVSKACKHLRGTNQYSCSRLKKCNIYNK